MTEPVCFTALLQSLSFKIVFSLYVQFFLFQLFYYCFVLLRIVYLQRLVILCICFPSRFKVLVLLLTFVILRILLYFTI